MRYVLALVTCIALVGSVGAGELEKGDREVAFGVSYSDTDFGVADGLDLGSSEETDISLSYGWMVSDGHQFGFVAGYNKLENKGGDVFADESISGTRVGGFYTYNFSTEGMLTPYIGGAISSLGSDLGDAYDLQYGVEVGLKIYPFEHAGVSVGLGYTELKADAPGLADADGVNLGIGLLLKY